jgi:sugar-specific transcriptional regulator TrmB
MKDIISKLEQLGFTNYESKVFLTLYQGYRMSAAEIAKEAKIPRTSVYDILKNFSKKGICNEIETPTKFVYEIIDTNVIESKIQIDLETAHKKNLNLLKDCFKEMRPVFKSKRPPEFKSEVELLKGFNRQREQKFLELVQKSNKAILIMNRFKGNVSTELDSESKKFFKRGGVIKSIYEANSNFRIKINNRWENVTREGLIKLCETFMKHGEQIKLVNEIPQFVAIFDEKIVYFSLWDENIPKEDATDIFIHNKKFAAFITTMFNTYWDKADPIDTFKKHFLSQKK